MGTSFRENYLSAVHRGKDIRLSAGRARAVAISLGSIEIFGAACQPVLPRDVRAVRRRRA
jgi:hypothetical protein